jgi:RHS repeat-associated protein
MRTKKNKIVFLAAIGCLFAVQAAAQTTNRPTTATKVAAAATAVPVYTPPAYPGTATVNYVRSWEPQQPYTLETDVTNTIRTPEQVMQATQYVDGLGRPLQTVGRQASPAKKDIVSANVYDEFGRETHLFLPYAAATNTGTFKADPFGEQNTFYNTTYKTEQPAFNNEQRYYGKTIIEASPLNRPLKTFAPGNSWAGTEGTVNEKAIQMQYLVNDATDLVRIWSIGNDPVISNTTNIPANTPVNGVTVYNAGELYKNVTIDERGNKVVEYKDKEGKTILKKVQADAVPTAAHGGWLCTYYIYDDLNNLRFVIPPKAVAAMNTANNWTLSQTAIDELCFRYEYDYRNRMIAKKVPGAGWVYMVYDVRDRLVFTQDANMRQKSPAQWMYILYDELNRPAQSGIMQYDGTRDALQTYVTGITGGTTTINNTGNNTVSIPQELTVTQREAGKTLYEAVNTIYLDPEFESETTAEFETQFTTGSGSSFNNQQVISLNPVPTTGATLIPLSISYYDDYTWTNKTFNTANNAKLDQGNNTYAETLPAQNSTAVKGMPTGSRVRVLEDPTNLTAGNWMETVSFYDEKGRAIQVQSNNYKGGLDITTNRYDFKNRVVSSYSVHNNAQGSMSNLRVKTNMDYDHAGRLLEIRKQINDDALTNRQIVRNTYDAMGQLKNKKIGQQKDAAGNLTTTPLEDQNYNYNIRGWLKGLNWDYTDNANGTKAQTNKWFSMDLSYDWGFETNQQNGNIGGMRWNTGGAKEERAYGFGYDAVNRLLYGDFNQQFGTAWQKTDPAAGSNFTIDFSMKMGDGISYTSAYDENGNIKQMQQNGLKINASPLIDNLSYNYFANTNKLSSVADAVTIDNKLSDFTDKNTAGDDYGYDVNGNLLTDKNKRLNGTGGIDIPANAGAIQYNHLNLPWKIDVRDDAGNAKGSITYIYDAAGMKLEKRTIELASATNGNTQKNTTTSYIGGFIYENNTLQFLGHEEGRVRPTTLSTAGFAYDYMLKDHLGNVRVVLTDEKQTDTYPAATLENTNVTVNGITSNAVTTESQFYNIDNAKIVPRGNAIGIPVYPNNNGITNNNPYSITGDNSAKLYQLNAATNTVPNKTGLGIILKVMAGDNINIFGKSYHIMPAGAGYTFPSNPLAVLDILNLFAGTSLVSSKGITGSQISAQPGFPATVTSLLNNQPAQTSNTPRASINWIILDEQFKYVTGGFDMVASANGTTGTFKNHSIPGVVIPKNGYIYVYCSNESQYNVFFDNLQVLHNRGPLLEETHYYPFGLVMAGISSKAAGSLNNKNKYNGIELNNDFELNTYDAFFRELDPQIGRWWQIDSKAEKLYHLTPYNSMANNPIFYNDPLGDYLRVNFNGDINLRDQFLRYVNKGLNGFYTASINDDGYLILKNNNKEGEMSDKEDAFFFAIWDAADPGAAEISINLTDNGNFTVDLYSSATIDLKQVKEYDKKEITLDNPQELIAHFIKEQTLRQQRGSDDYPNDHTAAKEVSTRIMNGIRQYDGPPREGSNNQVTITGEGPGGTNFLVTGTYYVDFKIPNYPKGKGVLILDIQNNRVKRVSQTIITGNPAVDFRMGPTIQLPKKKGG